MSNLESQQEVTSLLLDEGQELGAGTPIITETSQHDTGDSGTVHLLYTSHDHTHVAETILH